MTKNQQIHSEKELPIKSIEALQTSQSTDSNAGASEGYLGHCLSPDAVSGASAI